MALKQWHRTAERVETATTTLREAQIQLWNTDSDMASSLIRKTTGFEILRTRDIRNLLRGPQRSENSFDSQILLKWRPTLKTWGAHIHPILIRPWNPFICTIKGHLCSLYPHIFLRHYGKSTYHKCYFFAFVTWEKLAPIKGIWVNFPVVGLAGDKLVCLCHFLFLQRKKEKWNF